MSMLWYNQLRDRQATGTTSETVKAMKDRNLCSLGNLGITMSDKNARFQRQLVALIIGETKSLFSNFAHSFYS